MWHTDIINDAPGGARRRLAPDEQPAAIICNHTMNFGRGSTAAHPADIEAMRGHGDGWPV